MASEQGKLSRAMTMSSRHTINQTFQHRAAVRLCCLIAKSRLTRLFVSFAFCNKRRLFLIGATFQTQKVVLWVMLVAACASLRCWCVTEASRCVWIRPPTLYVMLYWCCVEVFQDVGVGPVKAGAAAGGGGGGVIVSHRK